MNNQRDLPFIHNSPGSSLKNKSKSNYQQNNNVNNVMKIKDMFCVMVKIEN